jgi:beta-lactam-binding protein with PASTA domain
MTFFQYLKTKGAWKIMGYVALGYLGFILLSWFLLSWYTNHGEFVSIPEVKGKSVEEAIVILEDLDLEPIVIDSIWSDTAAEGSVNYIMPPAGSTIKDGRQVYLTIFSKTPPMETVNIKTGEFAAVAMVKLKNKGIDYEVTYQPNNNFLGSIIAIRYKGKEIEYNGTLPRGCKVRLVVGIADDKKMSVPNLFGLNYWEAQNLLKSLGLIPQVFFDESPSSTDSFEFKVCTQEPPYSPTAIEISSGTIVDFYLTKKPCERDTTEIPVTP